MNLTNLKHILANAKDKTISLIKAHKISAVLMVVIGILVTHQNYKISTISSEYQLTKMANDAMKDSLSSLKTENTKLKNELSQSKELLSIIKDFETRNSSKRQVNDSGNRSNRVVTKSKCETPR